jgi:GT2 family glycosyltransferase
MKESPPVFSIIIPTYDRPAQLAACLQALARLDYHRDRFEVLVVDDGSQTPPETVVTSFRDRLDVTLLAQPHAGPAAARNCGAARAKGRFLAFTDDDCMPAPGWLQSLAARFASTPDQIIGGRTLNALSDNLYSTTSQTIIEVVYAYYNTDPNQASFFASNNLAVPADRFRAIGGFDETFMTSEDRELCDRWLHHSYRMTYAPEAVVYHAHALTLRTFWRQHFRYGRGAFRFHQTRARRGWGRFMPEPKFHLTLLGYPFSQARGRRALRLAASLMLSQVASAAGLAWEGMSKRS